jgi:hypothetical protein
VAAELFLDGPVIAVTNEDAVVIPVEAPGHGIAAQQAKEEAEIAAGVLAGKELGFQHLAGDVVLEAEQGELRATALEPVGGGLPSSSSLSPSRAQHKRRWR